jgi:hypothetical protein
VNEPETTEQPGTTSEPASQQSPQEIERDIERTRSQLGETAGALAHKLDPKAQAKERMARAQGSAERLYRERPAVLIGVAVAAVALVAVVWRRNS